MPKLELTDAEVSSLVHHCFVAAQAYETNAERMREEAAKPGVEPGLKALFDRLAKTFDKQAEEAAALSLRIENAE